MKQTNNNSSKAVHLAPSDKVDTRKVYVVMEKANLHTAILSRRKDKKNMHVLLSGD